MTTVPPPPGTIPPPAGTYISPPPGQPVPPPAQKTGCGKIACIGCAVLTALGVVAFIAIALTVIGAIKSTDAYKEARDRATRDPRVIELLGSPVEASFFAGGTVNVNDEGGHANIVFPIRGPKGRATVHGEATRGPSGWTFTQLEVRQGSRATIDLLR